MTIEKVTLKQNEDKRVAAGHAWVFSNEIASVSGTPGLGDTVELYSATGKFLGTGFYNPHSLIAFRLLTRKKEEVNKDYWVKSLLKALYFRKDIYPGLESFRAVFGESDGLPGLIVDKYEKYLSVQFLSSGLEKNRLDIIEALKEAFKAMIQAGNLNFFDELPFEKIKTKEAAQFFKKLEILGALIVLGEVNEVVEKSVRNLKNFSVTHANHLNAYDLLRHPKIMMTHETWDKINERWKSSCN